MHGLRKILLRYHPFYFPLNFINLLGISFITLGVVVILVYFGLEKNFSSEMTIKKILEMIGTCLLIAGGLAIFVVFVAIIYKSEKSDVSQISNSHKILQEEKESANDKELRMYQSFVHVASRWLAPVSKEPNWHLKIKIREAKEKIKKLHENPEYVVETVHLQH